jgi:lipopolysaccharide heptosyltransferase I
MHVLIVKTSSMGDVLHTLPALTDAMQAMPGIRFDWAVEENFAQIPGWHPAVDKVLPVAIRRWRKHWFGSQQREERVLFKRDLQSREYDVIIDAQGLIKSAALVTRLAKGIKHGQDSRSAREPFASWWYDKRHEINKQQHAVERTRELFAKAWAMRNRQRKATMRSPDISSPRCPMTHISTWCSCTRPRVTINTGLKRTGVN